MSGDDSRPGDGPLRISLRPSGTRMVVELHGALDLFSAPQLRREVASLMDVGARAFLVDLRTLSFLDAAGLRLLVELAAEARAEGWSLEITPGVESVQRILDVTGVTAHLPMVPVVVEAVDDDDVDEAALPES